MTDIIRYQSHIFSQVLTALSGLFIRWEDDEPSSVEEVRSTMERAVIHMMPDVACTDDNLRNLLGCPSLPVLKAYLGNESPRCWQEALARRVKHVIKEGIVPGDIPFSSASADAICFLSELGLPIEQRSRELGRRYLVENSDMLDEIVQAAFPEASHPLIGAMTTTSFPLRAMRPGNGFRHLETMHRLVQEHHPEMVSIIQDTMAPSHFGDPHQWREAALILRTGIDLTRLTEDWPVHEKLMPLIAKTGSNHGRMELLSMEPDLAEMSTRPRSEPYFGISSDELS